MRSRFEALTKNFSKQFSTASWKVKTVNIPTRLKTPFDKNELRNQYQEVDKTRSELRHLKSDVQKSLLEIQLLIKKPEEIRRLLTTSDETWEEALARAVVDAAFSSSSKGVNWSMSARIQQATRQLERLYKNNKNLPSEFNAPLKKLDDLLAPLESQLK